MRYLKRLPERHSSLWLCSPDKFVQETHLRFFQNKITECLGGRCDLSFATVLRELRRCRKLSSRSGRNPSTQR